jgi:hypothetical protein
MPESGYLGGYDRINAAFAYGAGEEQDRARGGRLLAQTLQQLTGLPGFSAAALIDFYGFTNVVQSLGELDMCVDVEARAQGALTDPRRLDALIRSAAGAMTVTTGPVGAIEFLLALKRIAPERITMVRAPGENVHEPNGPYLGEQLLPPAQELFAAAREDTMDQFVASHPDLVNQEA